MARPGLSYEDVARACDALQKEGQKVTARNLLEKTGGSTSTITRYWQQWRQEQASLKLTTLDEELSPEVKQALLAECARKATAVRSHLETRIRESEQQVSEMRELIEEAEKKQESLKAEFAQSKTAAEAQRLELEKRLAVTEQQVDDYQKRLTEKEKQHQEAMLGQERARTELVSAQERMKDFKQQVEALEKQVKELQTSKHKTELEAAAIKAKNEELEKRLARTK